MTITNWNTPILAPGTGFLISSTLLHWVWAHVSTDVGNQVAGCYIVDAAGKLRLTIIFTTPIPMVMAFQGIEFYVNWLFPTGA